MIYLRVYEWINARGRGILSDWDLDGAVEAKLDEKIQRMSQFPEVIGEPPYSKFGRGLFKLQLGGKQALRPVFCKGPLDKDAEVTFLVRAQEKDRKLSPPKKDAQSLARVRIDEINEDSDRRRLHYEFTD